jgi:PIN domain nuclease of toxin-antitoxin system
VNSQRLLLDTHAFVWWATGSPQLPQPTLHAISNADEVTVSLATLWEIVLKESTNHPMVGTDDAYRWFADAMSQTGFETLAIEARHIGAVQHLPMHHRDPFDRLLVSQARSDDWTLVSRDKNLPAYDVAVAWWPQGG